MASAEGSTVIFIKYNECMRLIFYGMSVFHEMQRSQIEIVVDQIHRQCSWDKICVV